MSSNIYEDPDLTMNVRYNKGVREDRGERVERRVDIYESAEPFTDCRDRRYAGTRGAQTQKHLAAEHRNPFKAAALGLGLLSLLLFIALTVLSKLYTSIILEKQELSDRYKELQSSYEDLSYDYCEPTRTERQTHGDVTGWKRFQCSCYLQSAERRNWSESSRDCQSRGAHLVVINDKDEHEFVGELNKHGASWIGLYSVKINWEMKWKWVDGSSPTFLPWKVGMNVKPGDGSVAYIEQGTLRHTNNGSKQWICERKMY